MKNNRNDGHYWKNNSTYSEKIMKAKVEADDYINYIKGISYKTDEEIEAEEKEGLIFEINDEIIEDFIKYSSMGLSINKIGKIKNMPPAGHIRKYISCNPDLRLRFENAQKMATSFLIDKQSEFVDDFMEGKTGISDLGAKVVVAGLESSIKLRDPDKHTASTRIINNTQNNVYLEDPNKIVIAIKQLTNNLNRDQLLSIQRDIAQKIALIEDKEAQLLLENS